MVHKRKKPKMKSGTIVKVHDMGTMWRLDVRLPSGKITQIAGDWRPMRNGLDMAFDISSPKFPYVSKKKIRKNVIGQKIKFIPDPIFRASAWMPLHKKGKV